MPGLFCILAGGILALVLCLGFGEEVKENWDNLSINEENFWEFFKVDKFMSVTRTGKRYSKSETKETYSFTVPAEEEIHEINFSFAVGKVKIRTGDTMKVTVENMFEDAITSKVKYGVWYIEDCLIDSGSVHSDYAPDIVVTIPENMHFDKALIYLAAGELSAEELAADTVTLKVDAGKLQVFELLAKSELLMENGVGEIKVYDMTASNLSVDNGVGSSSLIGAVSGRNRIKCGIGEVKLKLTDRSKVDFNYSVDCGIGKVEIAGDNCHGNVESYHHDKNSADFFELECGIGRIEIDVK